MAERKFYADGRSVIHRPSGISADFRSPTEARRAAREANARDTTEANQSADREEEKNHG